LVPWCDAADDFNRFHRGLRRFLQIAGDFLGAGADLIEQRPA
jgi:hypothetical protein